MADQKLSDGKSARLAPHRDGDEYIIRRYPHPDADTTIRVSTPLAAKRTLRTLTVGSSWEILHLRDDGATEVARYWPVTVIDGVRGE
jgi:hypothetical protein